MNNAYLHLYNSSTIVNLTASNSSFNSFLINNAHRLEYIDISNSTFDRFSIYNAILLNRSINLLDSNLTSLINAFSNCYNIQEITLDMSNVHDASRAFLACRNAVFNITNLNLSNLSNAALMFTHCRQYDASTLFSSTVNINGDFSQAFSNTNTTHVNDLIVSNSSNVYFMFSFCNNLLSVGNIYNSIPNMAGIFVSARNLSSIGYINLSTATNICEIFTNTNIHSFNSDETGSVINFSYAFCNIRSLESLSLNLHSAVDLSYLCGGYHGRNLTNLHIYDIPNTINNLTGAFHYAKITELPFINTDNVKQFSYFISNTLITNIWDINTSKVTNADAIFSYTMLNSYQQLNLDKATSARFMLSSANLSGDNPCPAYSLPNVTNAYYFIQNTNIVTCPNFYMPKNTDYDTFFMNCRYLVNLPNWDMSNATYTYRMFAHCSSLTEFPNWNFSNSTSIAEICYNCQNLVNVPLLNLNKCRSTFQAFCGCPNLSSESIANIINMLLPVNISTRYGYNALSNHIPAQFIPLLTEEQANIARDKGYVF